MTENISFSIKINVDGKDVLLSTRDVKKLGEAIDATRTRGKKIIDAGFAFQGFQSAIQSLTSALGTFTSAYATQERAELQLGNAMRNTMGARELDIQGIKELAAAQQDLGVIGDEVQLAGANVMAVHLKSASALRILIPAMNDMAAAQDDGSVAA